MRSTMHGKAYGKHNTSHEAFMRDFPKHGMCSADGANYMRRPPEPTTANNTTPNSTFSSFYEPFCFVEVESGSSNAVQVDPPPSGAVYAGVSPSHARFGAFGGSHMGLGSGLSFGSKCSRINDLIKIGKFRILVRGAPLATFRFWASEGLHASN